jgi:hypothetical protein
MLPTKLWFIWPNGFRGEEFKKSANQKQESSVAAMFVNKNAHFVLIHEQTWPPQPILVSDWSISKNRFL